MQYDETSDVADLTVYTRALRARWRLIVVPTVLGGIVGFGLSRFQPPQYQARASILLINASERQSSLAESLGRTANPLSILQGVLESRAAEQLIGQKVGMKPKEVEAYLDISTELPKNQIVVSAIDADRKKALATVSASLDALTQLNRKIGFSAAERQAINLETAIQAKQKELLAAQNSLAAYQKDMKSVVNPADLGSIATTFERLRSLKEELRTVEAQLAALRTRATESAQASLELPTPLSATWRDRLVQLQYELSIAQQKLGPQAPEVVRLQREVEVTRRAGEQEISKGLQAVESGLEPTTADLEARRMVLQMQVDGANKAASAAPTEAIKLSRLFEEVQTLNGVVRQLRERYETARVEAEVDRVRWTVLEDPYLSDRPVNRRTPTIIAWGMAGFGLGLVVALIHARRRRAI